MKDVYLFWRRMSFITYGVTAKVLEPQVTISLSFRTPQWSFNTFILVESQNYFGATILRNASCIKSMRG